MIVANKDGRPTGYMFSCEAKDCGMYWTTNHNKPAVWVDQSANHSICQPYYLAAISGSGLDWIEQCFTSPPTQYRLYGRRFLQVKKPNQQYQSTEGTNSTEITQKYTIIRQ